jgi:hypothetical protein
VASDEDIRQILHPAAARERNERWKLSTFFHSFINADPLLLAFYSNEKNAGINNNNNNNNECITNGNLIDKIKLIFSALKYNNVNLEQFIEYVQESYIGAVCCDNFVDNGLVVRTRGLPWQASDEDVALFFAGLNIAPGGVALCLSQDGRRNGEAIVKFETRSHRELALQRHRQFLHNRYIEVYRATGDDFLKVAVGSDLEAIKFASRKSAMIVRCRGLPFDCTMAQIEEFFASDGEGHGIIEDGILFVFRPDGRPSGDAFVLFADDEAGKRALLKHKNRIGQRYIELFRTTQAEVQQVFNRSRASPQAMLQHLVPTVFGQKRDCIRLRGLPYEATINDIADFMGPHSRHITLHGIHMVFNNHGNPSGECFIQMDSEASAASAAHSMHNKYMEIGKKKRYIEVFQWSTDEIPAILNAAAGQQQLSPTTPSTMSCSSGSSGIFPAGLLPQIPLQAFRAAAPTQMGLIPGQNFGATPFFHPSHALTPDQLIYASTQLGQFPFYSPEQLQLAAHQLEAATSAQAILHHHQAQLNAAQFHHHHHSILSNPTAINVSAATAAVSQIPQHDYVVPISAPPLTLIHT